MDCSLDFSNTKLTKVEPLQLIFDAPMYQDMTNPNFNGNFDTETAEIHNWFFQEEGRRYRRPQFSEIHSW